MTLSDLDHEDARRVATAVAERLRTAGHEALFCGGAVRDRLLGRTPDDYDVATSARPEQVRDLFERAVLVGARFGVTVVVGRHHDVEVATFRDDGIYVDGRHPDAVAYSDAPRDARRRDFTVNALFEEPRSGEVIDHVGGLPDLDARLLRAIGDPRARFREDHLRLLRAVRLSVQLNFAIEPATMAAIRELAPLAEEVSVERTRDELLKILRYGRGRGLRLLRDAALLAPLLPEIAAMQGVRQPARFHPEGDVFVHTCLVLDGVDLSGVDDPREAEDLLLAALLHDVAKPPTWSRDETGRIRFSGHESLGAARAEGLLEHLRMPRRQVERVAQLVAGHMRFANMPAMRPAKLRRILGDPDFPLHLRLHAADCGASHGDDRLLRFCEDTLRSYAQEPILPPPLVTGHDLLALGYAQGPRLGRILSWVRDLQLEGGTVAKDDAVRRVRRRFPLSPRED
jgi:poly(A) polymerase